MNAWLLAGAILSAIAALMHVGCILFGAPWYRFFGAGERMARLAEAGSWRPALVTAGITMVLAIWSLYALSGAGIASDLPLRREVLCVITAVYSVRGLSGLFLVALRRVSSKAFWWWSSLICLGFGLVHLAGLVRGWPQL